MAEIRFENVSKIFQKSVKAVKDIDLEIKDKEFVVLVGPSGCGKSTILRMIAGLEEISEGNLYIDNKLVNNLPPKDRNIAIVFQNYALYPHMTAYENLAFGLKIKKMDKKSIQARVMKAASILEIEELLDRKPRAMSGGQNQRVAIGRAIVREPKVFLFDEPLSNLDANLRVQMRIEIAKLHKRLDATVVYVTHDQVEAMTLGDRIVVLDKGKIQQIDTPSNLYANPANFFVAGFIGTPPMNFIYGKVIKSDNGIRFTDNSQIFEVNLSSDHSLKNYIGKEVILGIRSEDIYNQMNESEKGFTVLDCKIEFIEKLGHEIYAYFQIGEQQIISRLKPDVEIRKGSMINLFFDIGKMYFFDKLSGENL
ncbi:MAG: sn-glycerol-3-phosphate ABC transporter ATP-binding protein UgpC [Bacteroidales bacterium]|nr:sn-glycerol-3-phosphate ABC transporter ATP-binding protein UgpC [Bacteroidales bacterium]